MWRKAKFQIQIQIYGSKVSCVAVLFQIDPKKDSEEQDPSAERTVTIKGSQEAQWRASYYIWEKLRQEGFAGNEEPRLRTLIKVPKHMVGRVIGKGGKNVSVFNIVKKNIKTQKNNNNNSHLVNGMIIVHQGPQTHGRQSHRQGRQECKYFVTNNILKNLKMLIIRWSDLLYTTHMLEWLYRKGRQERKNFAANISTWKKNIKTQKKRKKKERIIPLSK